MEARLGSNSSRKFSNFAPLPFRMIHHMHWLMCLSGSWRENVLKNVIIFNILKNDIQVVISLAFFNNLPFLLFPFSSIFPFGRHH